jgi:restriction system protein
MFGALFKGWFGEKVTQLGLWHHLDDGIYPRFHDIIVPSSNGTTQIDHVLVSCYGIFVVETKNYNGWIFGDEQSPQWTVSRFGRKFQFQDPLRQNYRHTQCLAEHLRLPASVFRSVVFFIGECELKTELPANVLTRGLVTHIRSFKTPCLTPEAAGAATSALATLKANPALNTRAHLASLASRHSSTTVCPRCGSPLVQRVARTGANAGKAFCGCKGFPKCRFVRSTG